MSRLFVIGDVHGMADELRELVRKLDPQTGDRFAFLGDYVDKGPDSHGALDKVQRLIHKFPGSVAIAGNHEDSAMRLYAKAQKQGNWDGLRKADKEPWLKSMTEDQYQWLRTLPLVGSSTSSQVNSCRWPLLIGRHLYIACCAYHELLLDNSGTLLRGGLCCCLLA